MGGSHVWGIVWRGTGGGERGESRKTLVPSNGDKFTVKPNFVVTNIFVVFHVEVRNTEFVQEVAQS